MFLILFRNILCPQQMFPSLRSPRNIMGNTGFVPFFRNKFPGLFQDFSRTQIAFSRALKFTLTSTIPRSQCQFSLLPSIQFIFLAAFHRFQGLSRTSGLFPGLSSPGKCHNEIPGLSRFSRTRTNPGNNVSSSTRTLKHYFQVSFNFKVLLAEPL